MKKNIYVVMSSLFIMLTLLGCKKDEYDGLTVIDPVPAASITFPQSIQSNGFPMMDQNAFIVKNSLSSGQISLDIQVPTGKTIKSIKSIRGQRVRGVFSATPVSGIIRLSPVATAVSPSTFNRLITPNYGTNIAVAAGGNKVTWTLPFTSPLIPTSLGAIAADNVFRFYIEVELTDGTTALSMEVRVWITA
jgi:hypothetical protein